MTPEKMLYSKTHEWVSIEKSNEGATIGTVGVSAFAIEALTDLVFISLPEIGRKVKADQPLGEVESVKAVSDINSPVEGEVVEVNHALVDNLEVLSNDPFGAGWMVKIKLDPNHSLDHLLDYSAYQKQCAEEQH